MAPNSPLAARWSSSYPRLGPWACIAAFLRVGPFDYHRPQRFISIFTIRANEKAPDLNSDLSIQFNMLYGSLDILQRPLTFRQSGYIPPLWHAIFSLFCYLLIISICYHLCVTFTYHWSQWHGWRPVMQQIPPIKMGKFLPISAICWWEIIFPSSKNTVFNFYYNAYNILT